MTSQRPAPADAVDVRPAGAEEIDHLAGVWHASWLDAHERIVPPELVRLPNEIEPPRLDGIS